MPLPITRAFVPLDCSFTREMGPDGTIAAMASVLAAVMALALLFGTSFWIVQLGWAKKMMKNALGSFLESINKYFHEAIVEAINYVSQDPRFNDEKEKIKKHFGDAMWTYFAGKLGEMPGMEPKKIYDKMMGKLDENINKHHDLFIMIVDNHEAIQRNLLNTHANLDKILNNIRDLINNVEEIKNYQVVANARKNANDGRYPTTTSQNRRPTGPTTPLNPLPHGVHGAADAEV